MIGRNDPMNDLLGLGIGLVEVTLLLAGCNTVGGLTRDTAHSTRLVYESPASAVFVAAIAAVGDDLEITSQDPRLREIRLRRGHHMNGILVCHGLVMAVFLSPEGETRTRAEIVERTFSRLQPIGCHAQTPAYVERLNAKLGVVHTTGQRRRSPERFVDVAGRRSPAVMSLAALARTGGQSRHRLYPQRMTSRMEVDFSDIPSGRI
jgi:predicted small secreted protein